MPQRYADPERSPSRHARPSCLVASVLLAGAALAGGEFPDEGKPRRERDADRLTFARDVAPILYKHCAPCHRPGGMAPVRLLTYADLRPRAKQVAAVVGERTMPPWLPEPGYGEFANARRLSDAEIQTIQRWVDSGAVRGDMVDLPAAPARPDGWRLGEPDLVLRTPPYELAPDGGDIYRNFVIAAPVAASRHVKAVELRPGNPAIVHHARILIDRSEVSRQMDERDPEPGYDGMLVDGAEFPDGHFLGWAPGKIASMGSEEIAWRLDPGADLVVQVHLRPTGRRERIEAAVGLYFSRTDASKRPFVLRLESKTIDIPPGAADHLVEDTYTLPVAAHALSVYPHAHFLARDMKAFATLPDGTRRWLIWIKRWDAHWQDEYAYANPIFLPKGTTLTMQYTYDNSSRNRRNPHNPPRRVQFGPRSTDEMAELALQLLPAGPDDLAILQGDAARKQLRADTAGYEQMLRADGDNPALHRSLAACYLQLGRVAEAVDHAEAALRYGTADAPALNVLGSALAAQGRHGEAMERYREALRLRESAETHSNLGVALQSLGRIDEAVRHYRRALEIRPKHAYAHTNLGHALVVLAQPRSAIDHYREALEIRPGSAEVHNGLGTALQALGALEEAVAHGRRALQLDPRYAEAHYNLGIVLARLGRTEEAIAHYREALELKPHYAEAHNNLGNALVAEGRIEKSIERFRLAIEAKPGYALAHDNLGHALRVAGRLEEAVAAHRRALELRPEFAEAHAHLGAALHLLGQIEQAVAHYREALRIKGDDPHTHFDAGNALVAAGRAREAIDAFRSAVRLAPQHQEAHRNLATALSMAGEPDAAVRHFEIALRLKPDCDASLAGLAWILTTHPDSSLRSPARAVSLAERAAALTAREDPDTLQVLSEAYAAAGRLADAIGAAREALQLATAGGRAELALRIRERLELFERSRLKP